MAKEPKKRTVHWGVQAFVILHLLAITSWSLPRVLDKEVELSFKTAPDYFLAKNTEYFINSELEDYLMFTGQWQYWNMFTPNPSNQDVWVDAKVIYENGEERLYQYPRMKTLPNHIKYFKERYRKYIESAHLDKNWRRWPFLAQRIAYLNYEGEQNPIVTVELRRHFIYILPPEDGDYAIEELTDSDYTTVTFFIYTVDQEKLKRDAAE